MAKKRTNKDADYEIKGRRTKKDPIHVTGYLRDGSINISIQASNTSWERLDRFIRNHEQDFIYDLYYTFIFPALEEIGRKTSDRQNTIETIKRHSVWLHLLFKYWKKVGNPEKTWPNSLKRVYRSAQAAGEDELSLMVDRKGKLSAAHLAFYCIRVYYRELIQMHGLELESPDALDSFRSTYLTGQHVKRIKTLFKQLVLSQKKSEYQALLGKPPFKMLLSHPKFR